MRDAPAHGRAHVGGVDRTSHEVRQHAVEALVVDVRSLQEAGRAAPDHLPADRRPGRPARRASHPPAPAPYASDMPAAPAPARKARRSIGPSKAPAPFLFPTATILSENRDAPQGIKRRPDTRAASDAIPRYAERSPDGTVRAQERRVDAARQRGRGWLVRVFATARDERCDGSSASQRMCSPTHISPASRPNVVKGILRRTVAVVGSPTSGRCATRPRAHRSRRPEPPSARLVFARHTCPERPAIVSPSI